MVENKFSIKKSLSVLGGHGIAAGVRANSSYHPSVCMAMALMPSLRHLTRAPEVQPQKAAETQTQAASLTFRLEFPSFRELRCSKLPFLP